MDELHRGLARRASLHRSWQRRTQGYLNAATREKRELIALIASAVGYRAVNREADPEVLRATILRMRADLAEARLEIKRLNRLSNS